MYRRNCRTTDVVGDIRPSRKCFSFYGCLLALLLLLAISTQQASCRPSHEDETLPPHFNVDEEFRDVDNLEIHHVKLVNGRMHEEHPIIMYKEDFVDEDYVLPTKNSTKRPRKYKDIAHRRRHKTTPSPDVETPEEFNGKTEKIYFDFIPETPLMVRDHDGPKRRKSHIKLVPLSEDTDEAQEGDTKPSKDELTKRPKKYHRRVRREAADEHVVRKRNPYFRHVPKNFADVQQQVQTHYIYVKHAVPGKKHNGLDIPVTKGPTKNNTPISFDNRVAVDENDRVIFASGSRTTSRPRPTRRPQEESIFRDPRPENYDFSFMTTTSPLPSRRPPEESIFRDPRPENYDFSFMTTARPLPSRRPPEESIFRDPRPENYDFSFMTTVRPKPKRRPPQKSIFRDPRPENYDFSFMHPNQQATTTTRPATRRPMATRPPESIFRDPRPENYDFSFMNQGHSSAASSSVSSASGSRSPSSNVRPTSAPAQSSSPGISQCVWAIVNCCSNRDSEIRYSCFEQNGCFGAFWGLNPCAENNRDNFVSYVADYYN